LCAQRLHNKQADKICSGYESICLGYGAKRHITAKLVLSSHVLLPLEDTIRLLVLSHFSQVLPKRFNDQSTTNSNVKPAGY
jgi:hypothetical protein